MDEPGTALTPTQGEVTEQNRTDGSLWGRVQEARDRAATEAKTPPEKAIKREQRPNDLNRNIGRGL